MSFTRVVPGTMTFVHATEGDRKYLLLDDDMSYEVRRASSYDHIILRDIRAPTESRPTIDEFSLHVVG